MKKQNFNGITLVALVITIIILLILAGISISALTNQGLFKNAKAAQNATEKAEAEQGQRLNEYEEELNKYLSNNDKKEEKLVDKVKDGTIKIGDYVKYIPDTANTTEILQELNTYSGSDKNTTSTLTQESLNWRVLDVKDGQVRLISELPTTSKITLSGAKGYSSCKYYPTCSRYAIEAIEKYGAFKGGRLAAWRILRCNPFSKGGYDPVP